MPEAAVDTNWLLDVALQRDAGSESLWAIALAGEIRLFVPAICITEAIKVLDGWDKEWRRFSDHFRAFSGIATTEDQLQATAELADRAERQTWETLEQVTAQAELLEIRRTTIARASSIRDFLKLSAADAFVLSLVVDACEAGVCHDFVSRDTAFGRNETRSYMQQIGLTHWNSAAAFLAAKRAR